MYGKYLWKWESDRVSAEKQLKRAKEMEIYHLEYQNVSFDRPTLVVSAEKQSKGRIHSANSRACELFGTSSKELRHSSLYQYLPEPYRILYDMFVERYILIEQGCLEEHKSMSVYLTGRKGFMKDVELIIEQYPSFTEEPSLTLIVYLIPKPTKQASAIVHSNHGHIVTMTKSFIKLLNQGHSESKEKGVLQLADHFPDFANILQSTEARTSFDKGTEFVTSVQSNRLRIPLTLAIQPFQNQSEKRFYTVKVVFQKMMSQFFYVPEMTRDVSDVASSAMLSQEDFEVFCDAKSDRSTALTNEPPEKASIRTRALEKKVTSYVSHLTGRLSALVRFSLLLVSVQSILSFSVWSYVTQAHMTSKLSEKLTSERLWWAFSVIDYAAAKLLISSDAEQTLFSADTRGDLYHALNIFDTFHNVTSSDKFNMNSDVRVPKVPFHISKDENLLVDFRDLVHEYSWIVSDLLNHPPNVSLPTDHPLSDKSASGNRDTVHEGLSLWKRYFDYIDGDYEHWIFDVDFINIVVASCVTLFIDLVALLPTLFAMSLKKANVYNLYNYIDLNTIFFLRQKAISKLKSVVGEEEAKIFVELNSDDAGDSMENENDEHDPIELKRRASYEAHSMMQKALVVRVHLWTVAFTKSHAKLILLPVVSILYFIIAYQWWKSGCGDRYRELNKRLFLLIERERVSHRLVTEYMITEAKLAPLNVTLLRQLEHELWRINHAFSFWDRDEGLETDFQDLNQPSQVVASSICDLWLEYPSIRQMNTQLCETYDAGIMARGAHELMLSILENSVQLRSSLSLNDTDRARYFLGQIDERQSVWISIAHNVSSVFIQESIRQHYAYCQAYRQAGTVLFLVFCIGIFNFVYKPMFKDIRNGLRYSLLSLLAIPEDVLLHSTSLKERFQEVFESVLK
jgi:hypothetical protein